VTGQEFKVEDNAVTVRVATEFLARLGEWSDPVRVMICETPGVGTGWELIFQTLNGTDE
jgi:hypothetical protein